MGIFDCLQHKKTNIKIAVIGDAMLDQYLYGKVTRISPEAPVPIVNIHKTKAVLGGAANVAANLASLGCQTFIGGVLGEDDNRILLENLMRENAINYDGLIASSKRSTITKMRVIGGQQQMLRMDFEDLDDLNPEEMDCLRSWLKKLLDNGLHGIIISDYAKGVCSDDFCQWIIRKAEKYNIPVLVDPKGSNWKKYCGCTFITPNLKELCDVAGDECSNEDASIVEIAHRVKEQYNIKNMVITRSEKGITLVNDDLVYHNPATAREVFDVSGAGDTVAATFMTCFASGLDVKEAINIANKAAGIVVGKVGTYPVHREELLEVLKE